MRMYHKIFVLLWLIFYLTTPVDGQYEFNFNGQAASLINLNHASTPCLLGGARYLPRINIEKPLKEERIIDAELSANIYGSSGLYSWDSLSASGRIKPYRIWIRFSTDQLETRIGLQKLNFGSSIMLRPLMWFDQMDLRDPLQLTDGVWGILSRYYFLDNTNIWLWMLYGNKNSRGWDIIPSNKNIPEVGGRIQVPVPGGEAAVTYHHRIADSRNIPAIMPGFEKIPEEKFGFDAKWDLLVGIWLEGSFTHRRKDLGLITNQLIMNLGVDYTFSAGNGVNVAYEQLVMTNSEDPFALNDPVNFSLVSVSYPIGLLDKISSILYYNWKDNEIYSFINWQRQFDNFIIYLMAYYNPDISRYSAQAFSQNIFAGKGIQMMFVYNH